jgi:hypothetical protein
VVVTVDDLIAFGADVPIEFAHYESLERERSAGGSIEIAYEFDAAEAFPDAPYVLSTAEVHRTEGAACSSHRAGALGAHLSGDLQDHDEIFRSGTESRFGFLVNEGEPVGTFFSMCDARAAFLVMIGGLVFDDGELFEELITPQLGALQALATR